MAEDKALTNGATFERTYHGTKHVLTVHVTKDGTTFTVDGKKTEYDSLRKAAYAVLPADAAEAWKSLDGKQFWHVRTYTKASDATVASPKVAAKVKAVAKAPAKPAPKKVVAAKPKTPAKPKAVVARPRTAAKAA